jgi:hypothetical protein
VAHDDGGSTTQIQGDAELGSSATGAGAHGCRRHMTPDGRAIQHGECFRPYCQDFAAVLGRRADQAALRQHFRGRPTRLRGVGFSRISDAVTSFSLRASILAMCHGSRGRVRPAIQLRTVAGDTPSWLASQLGEKPFSSSQARSVMAHDVRSRRCAVNAAPTRQPRV